MIVIAFFELRRMNFSKSWIELIIWGTISKHACYKWRVSTNIPKHRNRWGKWVATLFKNFFVSWYPTRVLYISTGGRILDETLPLVIRISLFMSWYQTKRSFICLIYHLWESGYHTRFCHLFLNTRGQYWDVRFNTSSPACLLNFGDWISDETLSLVFYRESVNERLDVRQNTFRHVWNICR